LNLQTANNRTHALLRLANVATQPLRKAIIEQALVDARRIEDDYSRGLALVSLFATLPSAEKERQLGAIWGDIVKARYVLHHGELMLQLSSHLPTGAEYAETGIHAILSAQDVANAVSTLLREMETLPLPKREEVFQLCWQRILARSDNFSGFQFGMAAQYATAFWTVEKFEVAREALARLPSHTRRSVLANLIAVATRLGDRNFVDQALNEIAELDDSIGSLPYLVQALKFLPIEGSHRDMLRKCWFLSIDSNSPHMAALIDGFKMMDNGDKAVALSKLIAHVRATPGAGQFLAQLSLVVDSPIERFKLLDEGLTACAGEKADARILMAAQIASACKTAEERWRAFDLMTEAPAVSRDVILSTLKLVAPLFAEVGTVSLTLALMDDVRQSAAWWP
jgi:hypothetical protein